MSVQPPIEGFFAFENSEPDEAAVSKRPYSSIFGVDPEALTILLSVHSTPGAAILDCTFNTGKMWRGIRDRFEPTSLDINPDYKTDFVGDFRDLRAVVGDRQFDVLVFDPPHLPVAAASEHSSGIWRDQYGLTANDGTGREGDNVSDLFRPFFHEARSVLRADGVVLCKIVDIIHNHRYQWQHIDLIEAARAEGMTPYDMLIKTDPCGGNLKSSLWQNVHHLRRNHCYWIVIRNSSRCEAKRKQTRL
jgi:hypothetical protein